MLGRVRIAMIFRAIGSVAVRFRWLVLAAWVVGAIAAVSGLPSLSSVTQSNNQKFLPASAPSEHAVVLSAPFGTNGLFPIPVLAARASAPLTAADIQALNSLPGRFRSVSGVVRTLDAGRSADGHAEQLVVLVQQNGGNQNYTTDLVNGLRARIARAGLPPAASARR